MDDSIDLREEIDMQIAATYARPADWEAKLRRVFDDIDVDKNGRLEIAELQGALKTMGLPNSKMYIADIMRQYDTNRNGTIEWAEFRQYVEQKEFAMWKTFKTLDLDGSGSVDAAELINSLKVLGLPVTDADAQKMIRLLDADNNRVITFDEFQRFVCMLPEAQVTSDNMLFCWIDSADYIEGVEYRLCMMPPKHPMQRFIAGGVAGAVSRTVVAPLERLRTLMMADPRNTSILPTLRKMWLDGGVAGLWKGNMATVVKVMPQSAIQFAVYDSVKDLMQANKDPNTAGGDLTNAQKVAAGMAAGGCATLVTYPLETMRTQISMDRAGAGGYFNVASSIVRSQGWRGLYQGFQPGLINNVVTNGLGFVSYEIGCSLFQRFHDGAYPTASERGLIGGGSAIFVMTATMPLEVVMRRMQVQGSAGYPKLYSSPLDCVRKIAQNEGLHAFWKGSLSSYAKVVPSIAAVRFLYEVIVQYWGIGGLRRYRMPAQE